MPKKQLSREEIQEIQRKAAVWGNLYHSVSAFHPKGFDDMLPEQVYELYIASESIAGDKVALVKELPNTFVGFWMDKQAKRRGLTSL
jgi:hypothetical protein